MLENKKLNMIISLLIATALWAFVIGEVNPQATRVYRDVPIRFLNEENLEVRGMAIYAVSNEVLNVTLTGTRSEINQIDTKDISASVDLAEAEAYGENRLKVTLKVSNKVEIESQSLEAITVSLDERVSKEVEVLVRYQGTFEEEREPITIEKSMDAVTVSGAEVLVDRVEAVEAIVEENAVTEDGVSLDCPLVAVNKSGHSVSDIDISAEFVVVRAELAMLKTVPLELSVINQDAGGIERSISGPEQIMLKGRKVDLEEISSIETAPLDVGDVQESTTMELVPILPEGVEVSSQNQSLTVAVRVTATDTKKMQFQSEDIIIQSLGEDLEAEISSQKLNVSITGSKEALQNLQKDSIQLTADVTDLQTGTHKVPLSVVSTVDLEGMAVDVDPEVVKIIIKEAPKSDDTETQTDENQDDAADYQEPSEEPDQDGSAEDSVEQGSEE